jgi:hypothetical protein
VEITNQQAKELSIFLASRDYGVPECPVPLQTRAAELRPLIEEALHQIYAARAAAAEKAGITGLEQTFFILLGAFPERPS